MVVTVNPKAPIRGVTRNVILSQQTLDLNLFQIKRCMRLGTVSYNGEVLKPNTVDSIYAKVSAKASAKAEKPVIKPEVKPVETPVVEPKAENPVEAPVVEEKQEKVEVAEEVPVVEPKAEKPVETPVENKVQENSSKKKNKMNK